MTIYRVTIFNVNTDGSPGSVILPSKMTAYKVSILSVDLHRSPWSVILRCKMTAYKVSIFSVNRSPGSVNLPVEDDRK